MPEKNKPEWIWPETMDALTADPAHHRLLFENESVRMLDTLIPPGEITEIHTHKWPAALYILSWSDFIRYDKDGNIVFESGNMKSLPAPGTAIWSGPLIPHALKNTGTTDLHIITVEIKEGK